MNDEDDHRLWANALYMAAPVAVLAGIAVAILLDAWVVAVVVVVILAAVALLWDHLGGDRRQVSADGGEAAASTRRQIGRWLLR